MVSALTQTRPLNPQNILYYCNMKRAKFHVLYTLSTLLGPGVWVSPLDTKYPPAHFSSGTKWGWCCASWVRGSVAQVCTSNSDYNHKSQLSTVSD